jgi:hypothetical protein
VRPAERASGDFSIVRSAEAHRPYSRGLIIFVSRGKHTTTHLEWRLRLFGIGGGLGISGVWLDNSWLIYGALVVLVGGVMLRFVSRGDASAETVDAEEREDGLRPHDEEMPREDR